jgi:hypothetical protein
MIQIPAGSCVFHAGETPWCAITTEPIPASSATTWRARSANICLARSCGYTARTLEAFAGRHLGVGRFPRDRIRCAAQRQPR